jgi:hypothetical protein
MASPMSTAAIIQLQKKQDAKFICSACGADRGCNCNAPALEKLAEFEEKKERERQAARERMQLNRKKDKENQPPVREQSDDRADRAEARCAARWKAFTVQEEERNADMPTAAEAEESYQQTLYDQACLLLDSMSDSTAHRFTHYLKFTMAARSSGPRAGANDAH